MISWAIPAAISPKDASRSALASCRWWNFSSSSCVSESFRIISLKLFPRRPSSSAVRISTRPSSFPASTDSIVRTSLATGLETNRLNRMLVSPEVRTIASPVKERIRTRLNSMFFSVSSIDRQTSRTPSVSMSLRWQRRHFASFSIGSTMQKERWPVAALWKGVLRSELR